MPAQGRSGKVPTGRVARGCDPASLTRCPSVALTHLKIYSQGRGGTKRVPRCLRVAGSGREMEAGQDRLGKLRHRWGPNVLLHAELQRPGPALHLTGTAAAALASQHPGLLLHAPQPPGEAPCQAPSTSHPPASPTHPAPERCRHGAEARDALGTGQPRARPCPRRPQRWGNASAWSKGSAAAGTGRGTGWRGCDDKLQAGRNLLPVSTRGWELWTGPCPRTLWGRDTTDRAQQLPGHHSIPAGFAWKFPSLPQTAAFCLSSSCPHTRFWLFKANVSSEGGPASGTHTLQNLPRKHRRLPPSHVPHLLSQGCPQHPQAPRADTATGSLPMPPTPSHFY